MSSAYVYDPADAGKEVQSSRGNQVKIRKYHMTEKEFEIRKKDFEEITKDVPDEIKKLAGPRFFNPYRKGIYFGLIHAMYLLGANQWHELNKIIKKAEEILSQIPVYYKNKKSGEGVKTSVWDRFAKKTPKLGTQRSRDIIGRIQENMIFFQRLTCLHPSGYKLRQVCASVDMKKRSSEGIPNGIYLYRLSTYNTESESLPIRDFSEYTPVESDKKYISSRFLGKIIVCKGSILQEKKGCCIVQTV